MRPAKSKARVFSVFALRATVVAVVTFALREALLRLSASEVYRIIVDALFIVILAFVVSALFRDFRIRWKRDDETEQPGTLR